MYPNDLRRGTEGLALPRVITRGPPTIHRLAAIYAVLDETLTIAPAHLRAAREIWRYSVDSAHVIFGDDVAHPAARKILEPSPTGRTDVSVGAR